MALDDDVADVAAIYLADEVRIGHRAGGVLAAARLEQVEQHHQQKCDDDPQSQVTAEIAHSIPVPRKPEGLQSRTADPKGPPKL